MVSEGRYHRGPKRRNMLGETRLLSEYVAERYPGAIVHMQFRVGSDPASVGVLVLDEEERRMVRNANRRPDALVVRETELVLIEATMFRATDKVGRLQEYMLLARATPEILQYGGRPLVGELVTAQDDAVAKVLCGRLGFRYVHYEPAWMDEWWAMYPERRRRPMHAGMVEAAAALEEKGA
jgi:hypothetical protein